MGRLVADGGGIMAKSALPKFKDVFEREAYDRHSVSFSYYSPHYNGIGPWSYYRSPDKVVEVWGTDEDRDGVFEAYVRMDLETHEILSYGCGCPTHEKQKGMCNHAVAIGYNYLRYAGLAESSYYSTRPSDIPVPRPDLNNLHMPSVRTSTKIMDLVQAYANQSLERTGQLTGDGRGASSPRPTPSGATAGPRTSGCSPSGSRAARPPTS